ncbi:hypothetical protein ABZ990_25425 [Streptomyces sp. NPDC046203]|uniref:hypothetical protein n=1 Tax=Streptomyces sp. NPDC046203 TaxID=3154602 RepID=UPI00340D276C
MGKKLWRAVVAGGAAAVFTGLAAFPAGAAEGGAEFSRVKVNGGKPIVIGVANEVAAPTTFRVTTTRKWTWAAVFLYRGRTSDQLWQAIDISDCIPVVGGSCDVVETMYFDPTVWDMRNSLAGAWKVGAEVDFQSGGGDTDDKGMTVYVKRNSRMTVNASPEPAAKGGTLTVTGKITRADWDAKKYVSYEGRKVSLQFKPAGAASYTSVKSVYANGKGDLKTTVKASKSGAWRWMYGGNTTTGASTSAGDYVVVK